MPPDLLACAAEPAALPADPWPTNEQFIGWAESVRLAGRDCRSKVEAIKALQVAP